MIRQAVEDAFFAPAGPRLLVGTRVILSAQALWIALSRSDLPELSSWPRVFWSGVEPSLLARFALGPLPSGLERALYAALLAALALTLLGIRPRLSGAVAAALLYRFAPMEEIFIGAPHTSFGGLTTPTLGLFLLAFAAAPVRGAPPSPEYRWPVALTRLVFAFGYLSPFLAKLRHSGLAWFTADNIRNWMLLNQPFTGAPWGPVVANSDALCWTIACGTFAFELCFPLAVFSRRAACVLVPVAVAFHAGIVLVLGYFFTGLPSLLLFVDWDRLGLPSGRRPATTGGEGGVASAAPPPRVSTEGSG